MFGSIFIGLSGMNAFSTGLRQISNNIANINTTGFKSSDLTFANLFGQGNGDGSSLGHGVELASDRTDYTQGELRQTDKDLDLAIDGNGFLVVLNGSERLFMRTGSFEVDPQGFIVLAGTEYRLAVMDETAALSSLSIDSYRTNAPVATATVKFADNLSSTATGHTLSDITVYNADGGSDVWKVSFERSTSSPAGEWTVIVRDSASDEVGRQTLKFINGIVDQATAKLTFTDAAKNLSTVLDFSRNVTSFSSGSTSTLRKAESDGYGLGAITSMTVNEKGQIELGYSNAQKKQLGSVAIANFRDPQTLAARDGGLYTHSGNLVEYLNSTHDSVGRVMSRRLEASNVDLSREFGELIMVQRGFQASSQVVSASNEMIQQLFGIRGQG